MELVGWSLDAIDKMFWTKRAVSGEPTCPSGFYAAGYTLDPWRKWRMVCLSTLSVEEEEDIYIIGLLIAGMLLFGVSSFLFYRKIQPTGAALLEVKKLPVILDGLARMSNTQTQAVTELNRNMDAVLERLRKMEINLEKLNLRFGKKLRIWLIGASEGIQIQ